MLRSAQELEGYAIRATDGLIGQVKDVYFDDHYWVVRYLVVETGSWLSSRKVLISPMAISKPDWQAKALPVSITKAQVRGSPDIDTDQSVSRQHEMQYLEYYGYPSYLGGSGLWGNAAYPGSMLTGVGYEGSGGDYLVAQANQERVAAAKQRRQDNADPYLRSYNALLSYHIEATDGGMGAAKGLLLDEETWAIRYLIVETSNWWGGHQVLVAPDWIEAMRWADATIAVKLTRQSVREAPAYDGHLALTRDHEVALHRHHARAGS